MFNVTDPCRQLRQLQDEHRVQKQEAGCSAEPPRTSQCGADPGGHQQSRSRRPGLQHPGADWTRPAACRGRRGLAVPAVPAVPGAERAAAGGSSSAAAAEGGASSGGRAAGERRGGGQRSNTLTLLL